MRLVWGIPFLVLACLLAVVSTGSADDFVYDQQIYDERGDVTDIGGQPGTSAFLDIVSVIARYFEPDNKVIFELELVESHDPDAVYTIGVSLDQMPVLTLQLDGEDNFTANDERHGDLNVSGFVKDAGRALTWSIPRAEIDAFNSVLIDYARAELEVDGSVRGWDTAEWNNLDMNKGPVSIRVDYRIMKTKIEREVRLSYFAEAATTFKNELDTDGNRYLTQTEIDAYSEMLDSADEYSWTDMSLDFKQHISTDLEVTSIVIDIGPIYGGSNCHIHTLLHIDYPETDALPCELRWELELTNMLAIPYWRASDQLSYFQVTLPKDNDEIVRFDPDDETPIIQGFIKNNNTEYKMTGADMRAHWNDSMHYHEGFTFTKEQVEDSNDGSGCGVIEEIILIAPAFVLVRGWMDRSRRRYPGMPRFT